MATDANSEVLSNLLSRDVDLKAGECVSRSLELCKAHFSEVFVATLLVSIASWSVGAVPYFGIFITGAIHGVLYGGLYVFFLKLIRGQKAELSDAFSGFSSIFPQLLLAGGVTSILTLAVMGLLALPFLIAVVPSFILLAQKSEGAWPVLPGALGIIACVVAVSAGFFLTTIWIFTVPLVSDRRLDFWPAMELSRKMVMRHFWSVAALIFCAGLVMFAGILLCGIGVFFTMPVAFGAIAYGYETLFGPKAA